MRRSSLSGQWHLAMISSLYGHPVCMVSKAQLPVACSNADLEEWRADSSNDVNHGSGKYRHALRLHTTRFERTWPRLRAYHVFRRRNALRALDAYR